MWQSSCSVRLELRYRGFGGASACAHGPSCEQVASSLPVVPEMTIFRGGRCSWLAGAVARSTKRLGERSAGPLVWLWMPGDLVASHLAWRRDAEFHSCASAAAPISCEGVCFMLMAARSCSDARCGFSCPDSWPNGEIAPGASRRLRRVGAVVGNCASPTRAHVTRPCHFNGCLPPASSFQLLHSRRNWDRN